MCCVGVGGGEEEADEEDEEDEEEADEEEEEEEDEDDVGRKLVMELRAVTAAEFAHFTFFNGLL